MVDVLSGWMTHTKVAPFKGPQLGLAEEVLVLKSPLRTCRSDGKQKVEALIFFICV